MSMNMMYNNKCIIFFVCFVCDETNFLFLLLQCCLLNVCIYVHVCTCSMYASKFLMCVGVFFHVSICLYMNMFDCELCIFFNVQLEQKLHWLQYQLHWKGKRCH